MTLSLVSWDFFESNRAIVNLPAHHLKAVGAAISPDDGVKPTVLCPIRPLLPSTSQLQ